MGSSRTPEELLYQFPDIPKVRICKYAKDFYGEKAFVAVQDVCSALGLELVEGKSLHWRTKKKALAHFRWGLSFWYCFPSPRRAGGGDRARDVS